MSAAMSEWGSYELSKRLSLTMRDRELLIDRTCARCGCEYEWGVHVAFFAERVGLTGKQITSLAHGEPSDPCWVDPRDRLLVQAADALHETSHIDDALCPEFRRIEAHGRCLGGVCPGGGVVRGLEDLQAVDTRLSGNT
jgi:Carboxymuconolactone decarboxylase family